jgi:putative ABC transport system permease protein
MLNDLWQDLRYGWRMLRRSPGFTVVALLTLALGIGANTAIFSVVNAVLLRPLPYQDPDRLVMLWTADPKRDIHEAGTSYPTVTDWRTQSRSFAELAIWAGSPLLLVGGNEPERIVGQFVSANLFPLLGVPPLLGRTFTPEEEQRREPLVVLSYDLWQRRFGADPSVLGKTLELDNQSPNGGQRLQIIGVMPAGFYFPTKEAQLWQPATLFGLGGKPRLYERRWEHRFTDAWNVVGRLKPNVSLRAAQTELTATGQRLARDYPTSDPNFAGFGVELVPLLEQLTGKRLRLALWVLLGAVTFVLLIACANVANLLLARSAAREREFAIRAALGASRARLLRQLLSESVLLAAGAGLLGAGLAVAGVRALAASVALGIPRLDEIAVDARVLFFTAAVALLAGLLFGLAPAWKVSRSDPNEALKEGGGSVAGGLRMQHTRGLLVVAECALAVLLLTGAGLLIRSFLRLQAVNPGFNPQGVLVARVNLPMPATAGWRAAEWATFQQLNERIAALPGVKSAGAIQSFLIASNPEATISVEGSQPVAEGQESVQVNTEDVTPGFFETMGVPLLRGRFFNYQEQNAAVAIINETLQRRSFAGVDPVGKRFKYFGAWYEIVGVAGDMHRQGLEKQPLPEFFIPSSEPAMDIVLRAHGDPAALAAAVREAVSSVYRNAMILNVTTVESRLGELGTQRRFQTWLLALFAAVALLLAGIGIFGVMHYTVAQRTHEIGIRLALGASKSDVLRLIIGHGLKLTLLGVVIGLLAALWLTGVMAHLLFGVSAHDPLTFAGVALLLVGAALLACYLPARRAAQVDPLVVLRCE